MKHEWRKSEKHIYLPKSIPEIIDIQELKYLTISGEGNPNSDTFPEYIAALYSVSYAIKMNYKKAKKPESYQDYTVYPLEGVWDVTEEAKKQESYTFNKDDLVFQLMIRQPDFVTVDYFEQMLEMTKIKKPNPLLDTVKFETIKEGKCIQMLHFGSFDNEPASFAIMEEFAENNGLNRLSKVHKEIYLSDPRKVTEDKLKTVLRFKVEEKK